MKILFVVPRFHTNQYQMVKTLQQKGHVVFFHVASMGVIEDHSLLSPVNYPQSHASRLVERVFGKGGVNRPNYFPNPISYWRRFKSLKPDIVIIRDPYKPFSILAALCALLVKAKIIFYTQEEMCKPGSRKKRWKQKVFLRFFNAAWMVPIAGNKHGDLKKLKHQYFVPLPVPVTTAMEPHRIAADEEPRLLMIGKYHQSRKNHLLLVQAIDALKEKYRFKVTMVGECTRPLQLEKLEHLKNTIQLLGLTEMIELKQNVPFQQMKELYATHQIFVLPAINEQYGVSVTEALSYGLPVICTDTCGARFNISNGENGFVVKSNSLPALITGLEKLLSSKTRRAQMSANSLAYVRRHLSGNVFYANFRHLMQDRFQLQCAD